MLSCCGVKVGEEAAKAIESKHELAVRQRRLLLQRRDLPVGCFSRSGDGKERHGPLQEHPFSPVVKSATLPRSYVGPDGTMTSEAGLPSSKRVLEPIDRISEVLFGLIMVLTFTGSLSAAGAGRAEVREMLVGAIGCNLAWGLIDAIMYLMGCISDRASAIRTESAIRSARTPDDAGALIARALPPYLVSILAPSDLRGIHAKLSHTTPLPGRPHLHLDDWLGAIAVFLLVFVSTIPVVLPFLFFSDPVVAIRVSNAVAVVMMAATGYAFGRVAGYHPLLMAISMVLLGAVLVAMTIALGG